VIAVHEDRMAMAPRRVVSRISRTLMPSTPKRYCTPIDAIQGCLSTSWKPPACRSYQNHRGRLTRKPRSPKRFAVQRTALSRPLKGGSSRITAPSSGV